MSDLYRSVEMKQIWPQRGKSGGGERMFLFSTKQMGKKAASRREDVRGESAVCEEVLFEVGRSNGRD